MNKRIETPARGGRGARIIVAALLAVPLAAGGCKSFAQTMLMFGPEPKKEVKAECAQLAQQKTCILVWAEPDTLFEYPHVQYELSEYVRTALEPSIPGIAIIPNRTVVEYQRKNAAWDRENPASLGKKFGATRVLSIELSQYTTREPDSSYLYRGHISAYVRVYDVAEPDAMPIYSTEITSAWPESNTGDFGTSDRGIRAAVMEKFAEALSFKFYDRTVKGMTDAR